MSIAISLSSITPELKKEIAQKLVAKPNKTQYEDDPLPVNCFAVNKEDNSVYIPLGTWRNFIEVFPDFEYPKTNVKCKKQLYTLETDPKGYRDQNVVAKEAIERLKEEHCVFIAASPGYGKTSTCNYLAAHFKLKTAVLSHLDTINTQWEEEFKNFSNAKVQRVKGKVAIDPTADVYIFGVQKAATMKREDLAHIGLVIFDEAHIATITAFTKSLLRFQPKYVIALSATPKRADGMHKLLTMYFGPMTNFIERREVKEFTVYKVESPYKPKIEYVMVKGRLTPDWNTITNSIAYNTDRQDYIVNLCITHKNHRILVLSDRQEQSTAIYEKLIEKGEKTQLLIGAGKVKKITNEADKARIIVGGTKKVGTGFDDPTLTMLILASDCKNVEQWEGRIRTTKNLIFDIVDNYKTYESHWKKFRMPWYTLRGAEIKILSYRDQNEGKVMPSKRLLAKNI